MAKVVRTNIMLTASLSVKLFVLIAFSAIWISYLFVDVYSATHDISDTNVFESDAERESKRFIMYPGDGIVSSTEDVVFGGFMPIISILMTVFCCVRIDRRN